MSIAAISWTFEKPVAAENPAQKNPVVKTIAAQESNIGKSIPVSGFVRGEI